MNTLPDNLDFYEACERMTPSPSIKDRYAEPWRAYHNQRHIDELRTHVLAAEQEGVVITDGAAALAFILWHDAIYDPQSAHGRNEALSAQLCSKEFAAIGQMISVARACDAIIATIKHEPPSFEASPDAPLLLDCDLAILGSDPERFAAYDADIRTEYAHVPEDIYRTKRREVLTRFLQRDRLYLTDWAHARWEEQARENLRSAMN